MKKNDIEFTLIRSDRRTCSIQVTADGAVIVRAPLYMSHQSISSFVEERSDWIEKAKLRQRRAADLARNVKALTEDEITLLTKKAKEEIPPRAEYFASVMGVSFDRITIRHQKTRWGSCSSKKTLSFNFLLMLVPPEVRDYVIVHELCHLKEMNHSKSFWKEVENIIPDYKKHYKWLKENGNTIIHKYTNTRTI